MSGEHLLPLCLALEPSLYPAASFPPALMTLPHSVRCFSFRMDKKTDIQLEQIDCFPPVISRHPYLKFCLNCHHRVTGTEMKSRCAEATRLSLNSLCPTHVQHLIQEDTERPDEHLNQRIRVHDNTELVSTSVHIIVR